MTNTEPVQDNSSFALTVLSPLTASGQVTPLRTFNAKTLINEWNNYLQIDITDELKGCETIVLYQCDRTKLNFFVPLDLAGSSQLYEQLEKFDWYYMPHKWEHDVAIEDLRGCQRVLEIGAGRGAFVERLCAMGFDAQGIELNLSALRYAQDRGIPVKQIDLCELAREQTNQFDAVCSFQVLEHVSNPKAFLEASIQLLKPGGKLILAVPNAETFHQHYQKNLLDQPPHHMTRWNRESFKSLTSLLPLTLEHFRIEPLADYHVDWYIEIQESRLPMNHSLKPLVSQVLHRIIKPILHRYCSIRALIQGHTLYVVFHKAA